MFRKVIYTYANKDTGLIYSLQMCFTTWKELEGRCKSIEKKGYEIIKIELSYE